MKGNDLIDNTERCRIFNILLYPDNEEHREAISMLSNCKYNCAGILHDKDTYEQDVLNEDLSIKHKQGDIKKAHYHFVVKFKNARYIKSLAKELNISERFIEPCRTFRGSAMYLLHYGVDDKYQYSFEELIGNLKTDVINLIDETSEEDKVLEILDLLDSIESKVDLITFTRECCKRGYWSVLRRSNYFFVNAVNSHNSKYEKQV